MENKDFQLDNKAPEKTSLTHTILLTIVILGVAIAVSSIMGCSAPFR